jgi:hypothetical protein
MTDNSPGWQADPTGRHEHRYFDGTSWTDNVSDAGVASTDAYTGAADAADATGVMSAGADGPIDAPADGPADAPADAPAEAPGWAEPTTTMPAASADPTAAWPTTPAPPPPPSYTPPPAVGGPGGPGESGGSKRGLLIGGGILAAVAVAVAAFLLLGGGDDKDSDVRTQLAAQFRANSELSNDQADCIADNVVDELGADRFDGVDFSADEPPASLADDLFAAATASFEKCDIDPSDFGGDSTTTTTEKSGDSTGDGTYGSDPTLDALYDKCADGDYQACDDLYRDSPTGSEYEEFADTCGNRNEPSGYCVDVYGEGDGGTTGTDLPADFEDQLADVYESSLGLDRDKAECLAGKLADAISSGDLSEDQAMTDVFEYLSACDIDMSEISGN